MAQTAVNFRMDSDLKKEMERVCSDLGMSMSTAFTIFAKKMTREQRIPFEVSADPFYSEENMRRLREAVENVKCGRSVLREHDLIEVD